MNSKASNAHDPGGHSLQLSIGETVYLISFLTVTAFKFVSVHSKRRIQQSYSDAPLENALSPHGSYWQNCSCFSSGNVRPFSTLCHQRSSALSAELYNVVDKIVDKFTFSSVVRVIRNALIIPTHSLIH